MAFAIQLIYNHCIHQYLIALIIDKFYGDLRGPSRYMILVHNHVPKYA